jgi:hypothetical protein
MVVHISKDFSDLENELIEQALGEWQRATNGYVQFYTVREPNQTTILLLPSSARAIKTVRIATATETAPIIRYIDNTLGSEITGYTDLFNLTKQPILTIYVVNARIDNIQEYRSMITHEIGHSMCLYHVFDMDTIMYPAYNGSSACLVVKDLQQFCDIYHCDPEKMAPCTWNGKAPVCTEETYHLTQPWLKQQQ